MPPAPCTARAPFSTDCPSSANAAARPSSSFLAMNASSDRLIGAGTELPASARASSVLVGIGFARATPPTAESASAMANESVSFEDIFYLLVSAGAVPAYGFVLHQFCVRFTLVETKRFQVGSSASGRDPVPKVQSGVANPLHRHAGRGDSRAQPGHNRASARVDSLARLCWRPAFLSPPPPGFKALHVQWVVQAFLTRPRSRPRHRKHADLCPRGRVPLRGEFRWPQLPAVLRLPV